MLRDVPVLLAQSAIGEFILHLVIVLILRILKLKFFRIDLLKFRLIAAHGLPDRFAPGIQYGRLRILWRQVLQPFIHVSGRLHKGLRSDRHCLDPIDHAPEIEGRIEHVLIFGKPRHRKTRLQIALVHVQRRKIRAKASFVFEQRVSQLIQIILEDPSGNGIRRIRLSP